MSVCVYPFEAERALIAAAFAKRVCAGLATGPEVDFMCKFMDMDVDGSGLEDANALAEIAESIAQAQADMFRAAK